jgi:CubicO group peptidase (beta-lactamase class C family)
MLPLQTEPRRGALWAGSGSGSVTKQFTAAAVLLLAQDGKLSLDDPARKYFPELPDYPSAITIRHLLNHTSGLRDWGEVADVGGWPRGTRAYSSLGSVRFIRDSGGRVIEMSIGGGRMWDLRLQRSQPVAR